MLEKILAYCEIQTTDLWIPKHPSELAGHGILNTYSSGFFSGNEENVSRFKKPNCNQNAIETNKVLLNNMLKID